MILEVESVSEATSVGMMLERLGYEVVSARIERAGCPLLKTTDPGNHCTPAVGPVQTQEQQGELAISSG
jgi:hypothetical protein